MVLVKTADLKKRKGYLLEPTMVSIGATGHTYVCLTKPKRERKKDVNLNQQDTQRPLEGLPREGFDSSVIMPFFLVCCGCDTSYIVSVHIQCQASIYTLSLCRGYSWRVRLAKQETLTPPGHLVSPLVCRGP